MGTVDTLSHPAYEVVRPVTERASVLLANNPSSMTLDGTNTWVLRCPGEKESVIVDPGPYSATHVRRMLDVGPIAAILLTHYHRDHVRALPVLRRKLHSRGENPPVWALQPWRIEHSQTRGARWGVVRKLLPKREISALHHDQILEIAGLRLRVVATPGHTIDSTSFYLYRSHDSLEAVVTGDMILGRGSTVLDAQNGDLKHYLNSMDTFSALDEGVTGLPGHGEEIPDVAAAARMGKRHREARLAQVRVALEKLGPHARATQVVREVYPDIKAKLIPAALSSTRVQLAYLRHNPENEETS